MFFDFCRFLHSRFRLRRNGNKGNLIGIYRLRQLANAELVIVHLALSVLAAAVKLAAYAARCGFYGAADRYLFQDSSVDRVNDLLRLLGFQHIGVQP